MNIFLALLAGIGVSCGAVLLPGMLNMSVLDTSLKCGKRDALVFAAGIVSVIALQAAIGVIGSRYLGIDQELIGKIKVWAIPVFVGLAAFFFYRGYQNHFGSQAEEEEDDDTKTPDGNLYFSGLSLGLMNLLAIPYYYAITVWLFGDGYLTSSLPARVLFVVGVCIGCFALFSGYTYGARWIKANARPLTANLNFILGGLISVGVATHAFRLFFS